MKILIIGSKGFIGSHCVKYFSNKHDVWECDVILDYNRRNYIYIEPNESDFNEIFIKHKFDVCINCSGAANVPFSLEKPYNDFQLNTVNVFKILDGIRKFNPECKFINLSSAAVYGNPKQLPINEKDELAPVSPYGIHKEMAEIICEEFHRFWNIKTACIRIFSAYGPGLKKQLLWDLSQKIKENEIIELFGTGNETRDFIYIEDLICLIECIIERSSFEGEIINAANGIQTKVSEIASLMKNSLGSNKSITFKGTNRKGDPLNWEGDITKSKNLGYAQKTSIEDGINSYVAWLNENDLV